MKSPYAARVKFCHNLGPTNEAPYAALVGAIVTAIVGMIKNKMAWIVRPSHITVWAGDFRPS
jgi:hypothetical protein